MRSPLARELETHHTVGSARNYLPGVGVVVFAVVLIFIRKTWLADTYHLRMVFKRLLEGVDAAAAGLNGAPVARNIHGIVVKKERGVTVP